jgi:SAM-dependent methyltransferase
MTAFPRTVCPEHRLELEVRPDALVCPRGCRFPVADGIARFADDGYVRRFGHQWNAFARVQLDSYTGLSVSRDRLARLCGGDLGRLRGKLVLEAGCGAGRFTEVLLDAGARVVAMDLSRAVEANQANNGASPDLLVHQADILRLPYAPGQFDAVICVGVLQATPDPERAMAALAAQLAPGGELVIDHYHLDYLMHPARQRLRRLLLALPDSWSIPIVRAVVGALWPLHALCWKLRDRPGCAHLWGRLVAVSPVMDYHALYPQLPPRIMREWAILDTHDNASDTFKHRRGEEDIRRTLAGLGLADIEVVRAGNGVEARAVRPVVG